MPANIPYKKHIWKLAAVGFGLVVSVLIIHIMQFINASLYPVEDGIRLSDKTLYEQFINRNPVFLAGILLSNATGSFTGGALARLIDPSISVLFAGWVGAVLLALDIYNLASVAYPLWFWFLTVLVYIPAAWSGAWMTATVVQTT